MKYIKIGEINFSKVMCGTNAFYGRSHFSNARDIEYKKMFNNENIIKAIECCMKWGINTVETSANENIDDIIATIKNKHNTALYCAGSTRIDETSAMKSHNQKLDFLISHKTSICVIHSQYTDSSLKNDTIIGLDRMLDKIHEAGLITAISTHQVKMVEFCENKGYKIDTYLFPLNITGFVYPGYQGLETVNERINIVKSINKPFIIMKTLGAGRIPPDEGLHFIKDNSKTNDFITIGFGSETEIDDTMQVFEKYFSN